MTALLQLATLFLKESLHQPGLGSDSQTLDSYHFKCPLPLTANKTMQNLHGTAGKILIV